MSLRFTQVAITLTVEVPEASLERHLAASPRVVGEQLADQVIAYEKTHQLGYFPAIDFFIDNGNIEQALVEALHNIAWVVTGMVRNEVRIKLRPAFSQLKFEKNIVVFSEHMFTSSGATIEGVSYIVISLVSV